MQSVKSIAITLREEEEVEVALKSSKVRVYTFVVRSACSVSFLLFWNPPTVANSVCRCRPRSELTGHCDEVFPSACRSDVCLHNVRLHDPAVRLLLLVLSVCETCYFKNASNILTLAVDMVKLISNAGIENKHCSGFIKCNILNGLVPKFTANLLT